MNGPLRAPGALIAGALACSVASCGVLLNAEDPSVAYVTAEERELLELPPDLSGNVRQPLLRLPESGKSKIGRSTLLPEPESVRLVRDGRVRWLEFNADARELWPELKSFLGRMGFTLTRDEPVVGILETDWRDAANTGRRGGFFSRPDTNTVEKVRLRVERVDDGAQTVRVFLTQRRMEEVRVDSRSSPFAEDRELVSRPPDSEREVELMLQLLVHLGVREQRAQGVLTADEAQRLTARAYLEEADGTQTLVIADTFDRAWILMGELLEDIGLDVENAVKSEARYEVLYTGVAPQTVSARAAPDGDQADDQGFFNALFGGDDEIEQFYQVYVLEEPGATRVSIADIAGATPLPALEKEILQRLYEQLR